MTSEVCVFVSPGVDLYFCSLNFYLPFGVSSTLYLTALSVRPQCAADSFETTVPRFFLPFMLSNFSLNGHFFHPKNLFFFSTQLKPHSFLCFNSPKSLFIFLNFRLHSHCIPSSFCVLDLSPFFSPLIQHHYSCE